jgi:hypothetical protein
MRAEPDDDALATLLRKYAREGLSHQKARQRLLKDLPQPFICGCGHATILAKASPHTAYSKDKYFRLRHQLNIVGQRNIMTVLDDQERYDLVAAAVARDSTHAKDVASIWADLRQLGYNLPRCGP